MATLDHLTSTLTLTMTTRDSVKENITLHGKHVSRDQLRIWNKRYKDLSHQIKTLKTQIKNAS